MFKEVVVHCKKNLKTRRSTMSLNAIEIQIENNSKKYIILFFLLFFFNNWKKNHYIKQEPRKQSKLDKLETNQDEAKLT